MQKLLRLQRLNAHASRPVQSSASDRKTLWKNVLRTAIGLAVFAPGSLLGRDILRPGAASGTRPGKAAQTRAANTADATANAVAAARLQSQNQLARTTKAVQAMQSVQAAARAAAVRGPINLGKNPSNPTVQLPDVPNGLVNGGLVVAPRVPANLAAPTAAEDASLWKGAELPTQTVSGGRTRVTVKQKEATAVLNWKTFNIGKETTLKFDQKGQTKWTAFNKVQDPAALPSQILGSIEADGGVYVVNTNGIIFGGSSQVNTRTFVASALPINDSLISQGLLNNPDSQFLFSALPVPSGSDGTPAFNPRIDEPPFFVSDTTPTYTLSQPVAVSGTTTNALLAEFSFRGTNGAKNVLALGSDYTLDTTTRVVTFTAAGLAKLSAAGAMVEATYTPVSVKTGNVVVQRGAQIRTTTSNDGSGGRVMLVGANVANAGSISTPSGQTAMAAGQQLGIVGHATTDPSLRGVDLFVGAVETGSGTVTNSGFIDAPTGSVTVAGKAINQNGVITSTTSVALNGRVDLLASYGAVANPAYDQPNPGGPQFLFQFTGIVTLGSGSSTSILPDYASEETAPATALPIRSQINMEGLGIHFAANSTVFAPNAAVALRAGVWPYKDLDGNRTIFDAGGFVPNGFNSFFTGTTQKFLFNSGQIYFDKGSLLSVAGTVDAAVPLSHSILEVELRGSELADSPLQRNGPLRATKLMVDIRNSGMFQGRPWVGTPLGDVSAVVGLIQRNAAQLTATGGTVTMQSGASIVLQKGAVVDVSGGTYAHEGGTVRTSYLERNGQLVDVVDAFPDREYDGIYTGRFERTVSKWGVNEQFSSAFPLSPNADRFEAPYTEGANAGTLKITAPAMALDGTLRGATVRGERQRQSPAAGGVVNIALAAEQEVPSGSVNLYLPVSPTPPAIAFSAINSLAEVAAFTLVNETPAALPAERRNRLILSPDLLGDDNFEDLAISNPDGTINLPAGVTLNAASNHANLDFTAARIAIGGTINAPGGSIHLTSHNISPAFAASFAALTPDAAVPAVSTTRGVTTLLSTARLNTGGLVIDDRVDPVPLPESLAGGSVTIDAFSVRLNAGTKIDVSGGVKVSGTGSVSYGNAGSITVRSSIDPSYQPVYGLTDPRFAGAIIGGATVFAPELIGYSGANGGSLTLHARLIEIGNMVTYPGSLLLEPSIFEEGGFTKYTISGLGRGLTTVPTLGNLPGYIAGLRIGRGVSISPRAESYRAIKDADGSERVTRSVVLLPEGLRKPTNITLTALNADASFTTDILEVRGDLRMNPGSRIAVDAGGSITLRGQTVAIHGGLSAPGGVITIAGNSTLPVTADVAGNATFARTTVYVGETATVSVAGKAVFTPDALGRRMGTLYDGGTISVSGNIVTRAGALFDASGDSAVFDVEPGFVENLGSPLQQVRDGLFGTPAGLETASVRRDSHGGSISFSGGQFLFPDATLRAFAGGPQGHGGFLGISSNLFVLPGANQRESAINLTVRQSGNAVSSNNTTLEIAQPVLNTAGERLPGQGYFAVNRFSQGGFASLDLGFNVIGSTTGTPQGGNISFTGPIQISATGSVRLAGGGVVQANAPVTIGAAYVAVGQRFAAPLNPLDPERVPFRETLPIEQPLSVPPTSGAGSFTVRGGLIDIGTLSLQSIGNTSFVAQNGDIRGNGTLDVAGNLVLQAGQVYPTTLSTFNVFVYNPESGTGTLTIRNGGSRETPFSVGGTLNFHAAQINQGGVLRAPLGTINLGWDGNDLNPATPAVDAPVDPITRNPVTLPVPTATVVLRSGSVTSVSLPGAGGLTTAVPYGISPDGLTWIDPRGENITTLGLPAKSVTIRGTAVTTQPGSQIDLRAGGDLLAFRFVPGRDGTIDLLSNPDAFAIVPGYRSEYAPYAPHNTGTNARLLAGDVGPVSSALHLGDRVYLDSVDGLASGVYTLLPGRYALLPGAYLITPTADTPTGSTMLTDGTALTTGFVFNRFNPTRDVSPERTQFEVLSSAQVANRARYDRYTANAFFTEAATRLEVSRRQALPLDAGYAALHGNVTLRPDGAILTRTQAGGRGASVDLSSFAAIHLVGGTGVAPTGATAVVSTGTAASWRAGSLIVGGLRTEGADETTVQIRARDITLNNPGQTFTGSDITLVSLEKVTVTADSSIVGAGGIGTSRAVGVTGDGALLRVSATAGIVTERTGTGVSTAPLLTIGSGALIGGITTTLDSTFGTAIADTATLGSRFLNLASGQVSIVLQTPPGGVDQTLVPQHLELADSSLESALSAEALTIRSYRTIDIYGAGEFGNTSLSSLTLLGSGIRGFNQGTDAVSIVAANLRLENPNPAATIVGAAPSGNTGTLRLNVGEAHFGANTFRTAGYGAVEVNAVNGLLVEGAGTFSTAGNLRIASSAIAGAQGAVYQIRADGDITTESATGTATVATGLGASLAIYGDRIAAGADITLPSGQITLNARNGDLTVSGDVNVGGTRRDFYDVSRFSNGGTINLVADSGDVVLNGALITVSANSGGGNAGQLNIAVPNGDFTINGATLEGTAATGATSGSFRIDTAAAGPWNELAAVLNQGGFLEERNHRFRTGNVEITNAGGTPNRARAFTVSADSGTITVAGTIDASGTTGGTIILAARNDVVLSGDPNRGLAVLNASGKEFSSAGKGGLIRIEAGAVNAAGTANLAGTITIESGSQMNLGVDAFAAGDYKTVGSSAWRGQFTGELHLRAPRSATNDSVGINPLLGAVTGASNILLEGFQVTNLTPVSGVSATITGTRTTVTALPNAGTTQRGVYDSANSFMGNHDTILNSIFGTDPANPLRTNAVLAPGAELVNTTGDLVLGTASTTAIQADWDLADFRFGPKLAPGVLTLRAAGDVVLFNALSDGFRADPAGTATGQVLNLTRLATDVAPGAGQTLWLSPLMRINEALPTNLQSWSFRITSGSDFGAADFRELNSTDSLNQLALSTGRTQTNGSPLPIGSVLLGKFYAPALVTNNGTTVTPETLLNNRYQVIRTGTGDIEINAGRDVQLRNQFATIYTAGVRLPEPRDIFAVGDFQIPLVTQTTASRTPDPGADLGARQHAYHPQWAVAGGNLSVHAGADIARTTLINGVTVFDSSRQLPTNWLYRRGQVGADGLFADGGVNGSSTPQNVNDISASTTWWVDYSNFFEGFGALGGGDITLIAGSDIINADAAIPTNARMPGRDPIGGVNLAPDASRLVELGGGDLRVIAGDNIDGGVYYVERGEGMLFAGRQITTNAQRSPSRGYLASTTNPEIRNELEWLPTTLYVGKSTFDVSARGDVLLGPAVNPYLLPQGVNNKFWYKTYFNTFSDASAVTVASFGGGVTHRFTTTALGGTQPVSVLRRWYESVNSYNRSSDRASFFEPWIRLADSSLNRFEMAFSLQAATLASTAFSGNINIVGSVNLFPSANGTLELVASESVIGLHPIGSAVSNNIPFTVWTSGTVNLSDTAASFAPTVATPIGYQTLPGVGRTQNTVRAGTVTPYTNLNRALTESGSYSGIFGTVDAKQALHAATPRHAADTVPARIYAGSGDITGFTYYAAKASRVLAGNDILDVGLYIQNVSPSDVSIVAAGRNVTPYADSTALRTVATDTLSGNLVGDLLSATTLGTTTTAMAGDIQINGPGVLEVLAGGNVDLGTGPNFTNGTGFGITSIGNFRNPGLPADGAQLFIAAGVAGRRGAAAAGLAHSTLNLSGFISDYRRELTGFDALYYDVLGSRPAFGSLTAEQQAMVAMELFFGELRDAGREFVTTGNYNRGFEAIGSLVRQRARTGSITTQGRDIRTTSGGSVSLIAPSGGITLAAEITGNPLTPPGIVTEAGGGINSFTNTDVDIGLARIFTLRGGNIVLWSSAGNIAAGNAPKTVVTAPPTRVVIDATTAVVETDLGGLATGGGIGVLASVEGVAPGDVDLIAPSGFVDAGDAGIRSTGNLSIAAVAVLNASNITVGGSSTGVPAAPSVAAPNLGALSAGNSTQGATNQAATEVAKDAAKKEEKEEDEPSIITVEVIGYGGGEA